MGFFVVAEDETELKSGIIALEHSEERYAQLVDTIPHGVEKIDTAGNITYANPAYHTLHGYEPGGLVVENIMNLVAEDGERARLASYLKVLADGEIEPTPYIGKRRKRDGDIIDVEVAWDYLRDDAGEVDCFISIITDISDRLQAEEQKRQEYVDLEQEVRDGRRTFADSTAYVQTIIANMVEALITIDDSGRVESFNPSAVDMFGYATSEVIGQNVKMLMPSMTRDAHDGYIAHYQSTGQAKVIGHGPREVLGRHKNGNELILQLAVARTVFGDRTLFGGSLRDITELKQREELLHQAQKMDAVGQLTGGVAHDFNNLLTVILGNLDAMARTVGGGGDTKKIMSALRAAERGADLTHRLLAFSRKQMLEPKPIDVNKCVSMTTELMRRTLGEETEIETVLAGGLWRAMIDEAQLESALLNLALNSRHAMPGGGKLTIETANSHLDQAYSETKSEVVPGQYVMITVSDNGSGMPIEVANRVFEPFFTTKDVGEGSRLGLSMVYGFIKQSGGHVAVYSEPGEGTAIKLYLPKAVGGGPTENPAAASRQRTMPTGNETIFVVEDDLDVSEFVSSTLRDLGYKVLEAIDGPTAVALMERHSDIDLLLTDVVLPGGMSGRHVADAYRERFPDGKVLYTSGYTQNAIVHQGRPDEGVQLLAKPYRGETLARTVRKVLDG